MIAIGLFFNNSFMGPGALLLAIGLLWMSVMAWRQPRALQNSARNNYAVPGFEDGPDRFFALVYERLQSDLTTSQLPFESLGFGPRPLFARRHIFSARSLYLEVRYQGFSYYIYAVPAPGALYVSSWLFSRLESWESHPILQWLVAWRLNRMTLFQYDILCLFHGVVEAALHGVIDDLREEKGLRPMEEYERRPVLRGFYAAMHSGAPLRQGGASIQGVAADGGWPGGGLLPLARQAVRQERAGETLIHDPLLHNPLIHDSSNHDPLTPKAVRQGAADHETVNSMMPSGNAEEETPLEDGSDSDADGVQSESSMSGTSPESGIPIASPRLPLSVLSRTPGETSPFPSHEGEESR